MAKNFKRIPRATRDKLNTTTFPGETKADLELLPKRYTVPEVNTEGLSIRESVDVVTTAVEYQMLRGVTNPKRIATILGLPTKTVSTAIPMVKRRWEYKGKKGESASALGMALQKLYLMEKEAWNLLDDAVNLSERARAIRLMAELVHRRMDRMGWTPQQVLLHLHSSADKQAQVIEGTTVDKVAEDFMKELETLALLEMADGDTHQEDQD